MPKDPLGILTKTKSVADKSDPLNILKTVDGKSGGSIPTIKLSKEDIEKSRGEMPYNPSINEDFTTQYPADKKNSLLPFINEKPLSQGQQMEKLSLPYVPGSPEYYQRKEQEKKAEEQKKDEAANNSLNLYFKNNQAELKGFDIESTDKKNDLLKQNRSDKFSIEAAKKLSPFIKKKAELLNALENGELQISQNDLGQPYLSRPINSNLKNAWSAITDAFTGSKEADKILALKDGDELEKYVNEKNANQKYLPEETDKSSLAYQASSGGLLALKGVVGAAAGTLVAAAAPETGGISLEGLAPIGAWLLTVPDMSKQAKANALISYYERAKQENPNLSNADAYNMAQHASDAVYAETMLTGTALNAMATHSLPPNFGQGFFKATGQFLKNQPANVAEAGGYSAGASMLKDIAVKEAGYKLNHDEAWDNAVHSFSDMAKMQLVFNGAFGLFKLPLYTKAQAKADLVKLPPETINQLAENAINTGQATPEEIQKGLQGLSNYKAAMQKIAETGNKEKDAALAGLVEQKINLENEYTPKIENADPLFKDEIQKEYDAKVNAINEKMAAIKKSDNPFEHETDNLTGQKATEKIYEPKQFGREESTDNVTVIRPTVEPSENIEVQMPSQVSKPNIIENVKEKTEIPISKTDAGVASDNEPIPAEESSPAKTKASETLQPQQESITPSTVLSSKDVKSDEVIKRSKLDENSALADDVRKMGDFVEVEINPRKINIAETPDERKKIIAESTKELPPVIADDIIKGQIHIRDGSNRVAFAREKGETIKMFVPKSRMAEFEKLQPLEQEQLTAPEQTIRTNEPFTTENKPITETNPEIISLQKQKEDLIKERDKEMPTKKIIVHDEEGNPTKETKDIPLKGETLENYKKPFNEKIDAIDKKIEEHRNADYEKEKAKLEEDYKTKVEKAKADTLDLSEIKLPENKTKRKSLLSKIDENVSKNPITINEGNKLRKISNIDEFTDANKRLSKQLTALKQLINCT